MAVWKVAKFGNRETNPNLSVAGVTTDAMKTNNWNVEEGRDFREDDINYSSMSVWFFNL